MTPDQQTTLGFLLKKHFNDSATVCSFDPVGKGANAGVHFMVKTETGQCYGIKASQRLANAMEKEVLASQLCLMLEAPNTCVTAHIEDTKIPGIAFNPFNLTKWLNPSQELSTIPRENIQQNIKTFALQLGSWTSCGLYFGITDRHPGNWVWDSGSKRLAMIDLEDSFTAQVSINEYFGLLLGYLSVDTLKTNGWNTDGFREFAEGICSTTARFQSKMTEVRALQSTLICASTYRSRFDSMSGDAILDECLKTVR